MTIETVMKKLAGHKYVILEVLNRTQEATPINGNSYNGTYYKHNFPQYILLLPTSYFTGSYGVVISFFDPVTKNIQGVLSPKDFQVRVMLTSSNEETHALRIAWSEYKITSGFATTIQHNFSSGADPEIFAEKDGKVVPSWLFLPSKEAAVPSSHGNRAYWDGAQGEFDVPPTGCLDGLANNIRHGLLSIHQTLKKHDPAAKLSLKTTMELSEKLLKESAEEHIQFGCMPSLNAYGMEGIKRHGREVPFRSAGGHIHFGWSGNKDQAIIVKMIKAMDAILGVACVSMFEKYDDPKRRVMYGLAGEYRMPAHGLEYRVLSNAWLAHPIVFHMVFDLARRAAMVGKADLLKHWKGNEKETVDIINNCDVVKAREVLVRNDVLFTRILDVIYNNNVRSQIAKHAFLNGMHTVVKEPENVAHNWALATSDFGATNHGKIYVHNLYGYVHDVYTPAGNKIVQAG